MTPFYEDPWLSVYEGDCRTVLASLPAESVHMVCTSPPYWGLRSYLGDGHESKSAELGLEPTPEEYVANLVAVFKEVRRVLRNDGTVWLNLGDSYAAARSYQVPQTKDLASKRGGGEFNDMAMSVPPGLKPKDLVGIPWRVAFALQADGWYLRSDIVWNKPNPMPESVTDRPTKSHEYIFLLSKSPRYFFDADAVREGVLDVQDDAPSDGVPRTSEPTRRVVAMQTLFDGPDDGLEGTQPGSGADKPAAVAGIRAGTGDEGEARSFGPQATEDGGVPGDSGWSGSLAASAGEPDGASSVREVLPREADVDGWAGDADGDGVGRDPGESAESLLVLRSGEAADDGSRPPGEQGRDAYEGERGRGVPSMQRSEARSPHMAGTPRNDGDRWREVDGGVAARGTGRNLRSVWIIATQPYPGAHFATFPRKLVEPCIKAGTSERGVCPECGAPWVRVVARPDEPEGLRNRGNGAKLDYHTRQTGSGQKLQDWMDANPKQTTGWQPTCQHLSNAVPSTVLDPFAGSGTTGVVAQSLNRRAILIDLNGDYLVQAMQRNRDIPLGLAG